MPGCLKGRMAQPHDQYPWAEMRWKSKTQLAKMSGCFGLRNKMRFSDSVKRRMAKLQRGREKGVDRGQGSSSPASVTTDQLSTSATPAKLISKPSASLVPQSPKNLSTVALSNPLEHQLTIAPPTSKNLDLWKSAFDKFREEEPDLLDDYDQHVFGAGTVNAGLINQETIEAALSKLLKDREKKQWKISVLSRDINIRTQVERMVGILKWSDPLVKSALSTQPYAALAWSGVSFLLPVSALTVGQPANYEAPANSNSSLRVVPHRMRQC